MCRTVRSSTTLQAKNESGRPAVGAVGGGVGEAPERLRYCRGVAGERPGVGIETEACGQIRNSVADGARAGGDGQGDGVGGPVLDSLTQGSCGRPRGRWWRPPKSGAATAGVASSAASTAARQGRKARARGRPVGPSGRRWAGRGGRVAAEAQFAAAGPPALHPHRKAGHLGRACRKFPCSGTVTFEPAKEGTNGGPNTDKKEDQRRHRRIRVRLHGPGMRTRTSAHLAGFGVRGYADVPVRNLRLHGAGMADANRKRFEDVRAPPGFGVCGCADLPVRIGVPARPCALSRRRPRSRPHSTVRPRRPRVEQAECAEQQREGGKGMEAPGASGRQWPSRGSWPPRGATRAAGPLGRWAAGPLGLIILLEAVPVKPMSLFFLPFPGSLPIPDAASVDAAFRMFFRPRARPGRALAPFAVLRVGFRVSREPPAQTRAGAPDSGRTVATHCATRPRTVPYAPRTKTG